MTSKGPSSVHLETADAASGLLPSRRGLIAMAGAAALSGAAAALLTSGSAGANPSAPTESDKEILAVVMGLELTASDLYSAALETVRSDLAGLVAVMRDNHRAYAQAIAGATGISADFRIDEVYDANIDAFTSSSEFLSAAHGLEQTAVATHTSLIGDYESADAVRISASILTVEARQASVLADVLGVDDLDVIFGNDQAPLRPGDESS